MLRYCLLLSLVLTCTTLHAQPSLHTAIQHRLDSLAEARGIPGLTFALHTPTGELHAYATGVADVEAQTPLQADDRMLLGSVGKTFVAALAMHLVEQGQLDLDKKISRYLADESWFARLPNAESVTVRQLLQHTSGIPEYVYHPDFWQSLKDNPDRTWQPKELLQFIFDADAHFPAGQGWSYADANYIVLGIILEKVGQGSLYEQIEQQFLKPLELTATEPSVRRDLEGLVTGYTGGRFAEDLFGETMVQAGQYVINPQFEWAGGGFITTAGDLARWIKALHSGKVLSTKSTAALQTAVDKQSGQPSDNGYGLGADIFHTRYGKAYGHSGFMPGFMTLTAYLPDYDLSFALQMNADAFSPKLQQGTTVFAIAHELLPTVVEQLKLKADAQPTTLIFVRHAEKADNDPRDPDLTAEGKARAERLANLLAHADVKAIYATPFKRTQQTAQPLAEALNLDIQSYSPFDQNASNTFINRHAGETAVIVGHSNTVPAMINTWLGELRLEQLPEEAYDRVFIISGTPESARLVELRVE